MAIEITKEMLNDLYKEACFEFRGDMNNFSSTTDELFTYAAVETTLRKDIQQAIKDENVSTAIAAIREVAPNRTDLMRQIVYSRLNDYYTTYVRWFLKSKLLDALVEAKDHGFISYDIEAYIRLYFEEKNEIEQRKQAVADYLAAMPEDVKRYVRFETKSFKETTPFDELWKNFKAFNLDLVKYKIRDMAHFSAIY